MRRDQREAYLRKLNPSQQEIELQIDELVLDGFVHADRYAIGNALAAEIQRLLANAGRQPFLEHSVDRPTLDTGRVTLVPHAGPAAVGTQVAQAVHASLSQTDGGKR